MTAKETLQKYGLKTDVKSIRERIIHNDYSCISEIEQEQRSADISLLCDLAEKGESALSSPSFDDAVQMVEGRCQYFEDLINEEYYVDPERKQNWLDEIEHTFNELLTALRERGKGK